MHLTSVDLVGNSYKSHVEDLRHSGDCWNDREKVCRKEGNNEL